MTRYKDSARVDAEVSVYTRVILNIAAKNAKN